METERLILREIIPEDENDMFFLDSDPRVHEFLGGNPITSIRQAREMINFIRQQYLDAGIGRWAVIEKKTGHFMGWAGLKFITEKTNDYINYYDLGYRLMKKYWGQGFASEAAKAILCYAFETLQLSEVFAIADIQNLQSTKVLIKSGLKYIETFNHNGIVHNWFRIYRTDWLKNLQA